jgi:hypothetical protein
MNPLETVPPTVLTDEQIDAHLDAVLKASGSALRHYSIRGTKDAMRATVRAIEAASLAAAREALAIDQHAGRGEPVAQLRHLCEDIVVTYQEDGLDRHMVADGKGLLFSNLVGACKRMLADAATQPQEQYMSLQEAWNLAGGNPGITPTRDEVVVALKTLDKVCDEADEVRPLYAATQPAAPKGEVAEQQCPHCNQWFDSIFPATTPSPTLAATQPAASSTGQDELLNAARVALSVLQDYRTPSANGASLTLRSAIAAVTLETGS